MKAKSIYLPLLLALFCSAISPAQWVQVNNGLTSTRAFALTFLGSNLFAGTYDGNIFLSTNNGTTWTPVDSGLVNNGIWTLTASSTNLFAGTSGGVWFSTNSGTSWDTVNTGLPNSWVYAFAISGGNLFAGTNFGVFLTTNDGTYWTPVNSDMTTYPIACLATSSTNLFAGTWGNGLFRSTNYGTTWMAVDSGLTTSGVYSLAMSGTNLFAGTGGGVFLSTNNGTSWMHTGLISGMVRFLLMSGTNLFAGTDAYGVLQSKNNGTTWAQVNSGLTQITDTTLHIGDNVIVTLSTDCVNARSIPSLTGSTIIKCEPASTAGVIVAGPSNDINSSSNYTFWQVAYSDGIIGWSASVYLTKTGVTPSIHTLLVYGTNLFAGTDGAGVWRIPLNEALPIQLASFKVAPLSNGVTLSWNTVSETNNYGFYVQRNGVDITFIAGHGTTLQSHTYSYTDNPSPGQYQYRLRQVDLNGTVTFSESVTIPVSAPQKFTLAQNYPNPFNPATKISFSITKEGPVSLRVYDILGREVSTLVNENRKAGQYTEQFNGNEVASGVYMYVLKSSEGQLVGRMMLLK